MKAFMSLCFVSVVVAVPAGQITEEVVEQEPYPSPARKRRIEPAAILTRPKDKVSKGPHFCGLA
jgi:hypothetical protein